MKGSSRCIALALAAGFCLAGPPALRAGTTWDGGGVANALWTETANWNGDSLPTFNGSETITIKTVDPLGQVSDLDGDKSISLLVLDTAASPFTINNDTLTLTSGALTRLGPTTAAHTINSNIQLDAVGNWINGANGNGTFLTVNGAINGVGGINAISSGRTILAGNNSYTGATTITGGGYLAITGNNTTTADTTFISTYLYLGHNNALGSGKLIFANPSSVLFGSFSNSAVTISNNYSLNGGGTIYLDNKNASGNNAPTGTILTLDGAADPLTGNTTLWGQGPHAGLDIKDNLSGSGGLNLRGQARLYLSGDNSYSGDSVYGVGVSTTEGVFLNGNNTTTGKSTIDFSGIVQVGSNTAFGSGDLVLRSYLLRDQGVARTLANKVIFDVTHPLGFYFGGNFTFTGPVELNADTTVISHTATTVVDFQGDISDGGNNRVLTFNRYGQTNAVMRLSGNNSYSGGTVLPNAGILELGGDNALGSGSLTISDISVRVKAVNGNRALPNAVIFDKSNLNALNYGFSGPLTFTGTFALSDTGGVDTERLIYVNTGGNLNLAGGVVEGTNGANLSLRKEGVGTLTLGAGGSYTKPTLVNTGMVVVTGNNALGTIAGNTVVASGATLGFQGGVNYTTAEPLSVTGNGYTNAGALRNISDDNRFAGPITLTNNTRITTDKPTAAMHRLTLTGDVSGAFNLEKQGPGILRFRNNTVTVNNLNVNAGAVAGNVDLVGNLVLASAAGFIVDINIPVGFDQWDVSGGVTLNSASLIATVSGVVQKWQRLFIVINDSTDAVNGTFRDAMLNPLPQGTIVDLGNFQGGPNFARISYTGDFDSNSLTGGNDIVLYAFDVVPEPASLALLGLGLTLVTLRRR